MDLKMDRKYSIFQYNKRGIEFTEDDNIEPLLTRVDPNRVNWITMTGITLQADHVAVKQVLEHFKLQPLLFNSIFEYEQKHFEGEYDDCLYMDYSVLLYDSEHEAYTRAPGSIILGRHFLILLEKKPVGLFAKTRERIIRRHTKAQRFGADYLLYLLIKTMVFNYQTIIKQLVLKFEMLEDEVITHPAEDYIYDKILAMREQVKPIHTHTAQLDDFVDALQDEQTQFITGNTRRYFTRTLDRETDDLLDAYQHLRSWVTELLDIHRAAVNENTNRVMQVLTIISTIFLPLTFIAGIYGMNFENMPELQWPLAYPAVLMLMALIAAGILFFIWRRHWL
jgi:magnesium transporter